METKKVKKAPAKRKVTPKVGAPKTAEQRWADIQKKLSLPKYQGQGYNAEMNIELKAELFSDIYTVQHGNTRAILEMMSTVEAMKKVLTGMIQDNDAITLDILEKHLSNVDKGLTTKVDLTALEKIQELDGK